METTDIEQPCVRLAKQAGYIHRKLDTGPGGKGWPDQIFWGPKGTYLLIEFKVPDKTPSKLQTDRISEFKRRGHTVHIIHSLNEFSDLLAQQLVKIHHTE